MIQRRSNLLGMQRPHPNPAKPESATRFCGAAMRKQGETEGRKQSSVDMKRNTPNMGV